MYYLHYNLDIQFVYIIYDFSGFNIKFQINVDNKSFLIEKQSSIDDLLYLEACCNEEDNVLQRKVFDSVYLKAITESQPEQRLERFFFFYFNLLKFVSIKQN